MGKSRRVFMCLVIVSLVLGGIGLGNAAEKPKKLQLKLQSHLIPVDVERTMRRFVDTVSTMSGGQIEITLFGVGAIVPMKEVLSTVGKGALDMAQIAEGYWHSLVPVSELAGLPFAFRDLTEAKHFMYNKGFGDLLKEGYAKHNVYHIPYEAYPVGIISRNPISKVDDLKGMKLRAYGVMAEWLTQLGASTSFIAGGELYTALATGVVDGCHWGDAGPMFIMRFHEILKNYMVPEPIVGAWNNLIVNMDLWKRLTPEQRMIIETAAMAFGGWSGDNTRILAKTSLKEMAQQWNVTVNEVPEEEQEKMMKASMVVWDKLAKKDPVNAKALDSMKAFLKELGYIK
jgi:TRAP-type C4-dicarboxylate transport system substrate-binding protein